MRKLFTLFIAVFTITSLWAQAPQKMSYQAVIRQASGDLVVSSTLGMRISILQSSALGSSVYIETQAPSTNANGLVSIEIGTGSVVSGTFSSIDWSNGPYFIKTEIDPAGGTDYSAIVGTSQLMSVPYALYAKTAANGSKWTALSSDIYFSTGKVGIGSSGAPAYALDVTGDVNVTGNFKVNGVNFGGNSNRFTLGDSNGNVSNWSTDQVVFARASGTQADGLAISYSDGDNSSYISSIKPSNSWRDLGFRAKDTKFYGGSNESMRLTMDGNLGIGTNAPSDRLSIVKWSPTGVADPMDPMFTEESYDIGMGIYNSSDYISGNVRGGYLNLGKIASGTAQPMAQLVGHPTDGASANNGSLDLKTRTSGTLTTKLSINENGNANLTGSLTTGAVTYPKVDGTSGQVLSTNGSGTVGWSTPGTSSRLVLASATVIISASGTEANNYDVSGIGILFIKATSGWNDVTGLSGGVTGQVLQIVNSSDETTYTGSISLMANHADGTQKFAAYGSIGIQSYKGITLVFDGTFWRAAGGSGM